MSWPKRDLLLVSNDGGVYVNALAKALKLPAAELLGDIEGLSAEGVEAARLFESAPADVQDAVLRLLRAVVRKRR